MKTLSDCHYATVIVTQPPASGYSDSPPDPIETCDECGQPCEGIDFECPCSGVESVRYYWIAQCDILDEGKFDCPYSNIPFLQKRRPNLPDCPFYEEE